MLDHGLVGEFDQWLGKSEGLAGVRGYEALSTVGPPHIGSCLGYGRTRGRRRVPYPPTRIKAGKNQYVGHEETSKSEKHTFHTGLE